MMELFEQSTDRHFLLQERPAACSPLIHMGWPFAYSNAGER